jgi:hypothetical protein
VQTDAGSPQGLSFMLLGGPLDGVQVQPDPELCWLGGF